MQAAQLHLWTARGLSRWRDPAHSPCSSMVSLSFKLTFPDCTARRTVEAYSWEVGQTYVRIGSTSSRNHCRLPFNLPTFKYTCHPNTEKQHQELQRKLHPPPNTTCSACGSAIPSTLHSHTHPDTAVTVVRGSRQRHPAAGPAAVAGVTAPLAKLSWPQL